MKHPTLSIVTTVKNGARFLPDAIDSIRRQSYAYWTYHVIDAGSSDDSFEIAKAAAKDDARITVEQAPGEPLYQSVMRGLERAEGDFLAWLNADDLYTPWAFSSVARFVHQNQNARWLTGLPACWDAAGDLRYVRPVAWYPQTLIQKGMFTARGLGYLQQESMFFAREMFADLSADERREITDMTYAGDFCLWKHFAARDKLHVIPTVVGGFRRHGNNLSARHAEDYEAEAAASGAWLPSAYIGYAGRRLYQWLAAINGPKLVEAAEQAMLAEEQV